MTPILIQFAIGLYFVVADSPVLFSRPASIGTIIRFLLGVLLVLLAFLGVSILQ